jgi:hypothetical protein
MSATTIEEAPELVIRTSVTPLFFTPANGFQGLDLGVGSTKVTEQVFRHYLICGDLLPFVKALLVGLKKGFQAFVSSRVIREDVGRQVFCILSNEALRFSFPINRNEWPPLLGAIC